jgi:predicted PurR-regulated permease PerM
MLFVLLVSYFILVESGGLRNQLIKFDVPYYKDDISRLNRELGRIWNAFLRGQLIIFVLTVIVYTIVLGILGVHYAFGIAILAGFARFVPYIGPAVNWLILFLVTYFQPYKIFGMQPLYYSLMVIGMALVIDQIFDSLISPRILADALKVHPAAVLVAAIICANLFGLLGVIVAAPILATIALIGRYTMRKMFDLDPWPEPEVKQPPPPPASRLLVQLRQWWRKIRAPRSPIP